jgi:hypothetical protein
MNSHWLLCIQMNFHWLLRIIRMRLVKIVAHIQLRCDILILIRVQTQAAEGSCPIHH